MQWIHLLAYEKGESMAIYMKIDDLTGDATETSSLVVLKIMQTHEPSHRGLGVQLHVNRAQTPMRAGYNLETIEAM